MVAFVHHRYQYLLTRRMRLIIFFWLLAVCVNSACITLNYGPPMSAECQDFYKDREGHTEDFKHYDLDKQLRIYHCGLHREPPDIMLGSYIARRGESVIPTLLQKLESATDDETKYEIIDVFSSMANLGYLRSRPEVISRTRSVVDQMNNPHWKRESEIALERIENNGSGL